MAQRSALPALRRESALNGQGAAGGNSDTPSSPLPNTKNHKHKAQTHPRRALKHARGHARARSRVCCAGGYGAVFCGGARRGGAPRASRRRHKRADEEEAQGGIRAPYFGRRTPDTSPAAALRARRDERQDGTRETTRQRGYGSLRGRIARRSRDFSDRGAAALRASRRETSDRTRRRSALAGGRGAERTMLQRK